MYRPDFIVSFDKAEKGAFYIDLGVVFAVFLSVLVWFAIADLFSWIPLTSPSFATAGFSSVPNLA